MKNQFSGLLVVNVELTSRCNKNCWMCGRRKIDRDYPKLKLNYGDINFSLLEQIAHQLPEGIIVQFHSNGEPTLYPKLSKALQLFPSQIRTFDTNGKLLVEKAHEIIGNLDTLTISVIENDPEADEQYQTVKKFLKIKGNKNPRLIYRLLGDVSIYGECEDTYHIPLRDTKRIERWKKLPGLIATRTLHHSLGSYQYEKKVIVPEHGICLEVLSHLVINKDGDVFPCVRFNPHNYNKLGNVKEQKLIDIWNSNKRKALVATHIEGRRQNLSLCNKCEYWGCPIA